MTSHRPADFSARVLGLSMMMLAACGGGGSKSNPTTSTSTGLTISNLVVTFQQACTLNGQGGTVEVLTFDYTDPEGDVRGGSVENRSTPNVGAPITLTAAVPSPAVTISGTTSGTVTLTECTRFGSITSITEAVTLVDAAGHRSNDLSTVVNRPSGAPEVPRSGDTSSPGAIKRLGR